MTPPSPSHAAAAEVAALPTLPSYSEPSQPPPYLAQSPLPPTAPHNTPTKSIWGAATSSVSQGPTLWRAKDTKHGSAEEETTVWNGNVTEQQGGKQSIWSSKGTSQGASLWADRRRSDQTNVWGTNV
ncbi:hypothetical protein BCR35DRAFT_302962 [Leucosporidium creatinivorum]|uniref:Uncharacterized protein n=1 Tax=Leucosporidium creatinivorum TaxID=106004 RepID=A0A1Y2FN64_9BASI|nr:hypothetical protein BCR35DRAFT_302962 [Leucosporidium creatinivorum]